MAVQMYRLTYVKSKNRAEDTATTELHDFCHPIPETRRLLFLDNVARDQLMLMINVDFVLDRAHVHCLPDQLGW